MLHSNLNICLLVFAILNSVSSCNEKNKRLVKRSDNDIVVKTEYGSVRGTQNATIGQKKTYYAFRGIPYAQPPIGDLRFEPPIAPQPWEGILDATQDKDQCVQGGVTVIGSENCLFANIYTPKLPNGENISLPVMVWIHGGGFVAGNAWYNASGPDYFLEQDVVVAMISYRLGIFGFISTNDLVAPGNGGLKDQIFAIKWVQRNIANFGGNSNSITLFGGSAGAASVSYHLQSKLSQGVFQRGIMQSGTSLAVWALSRLIKRATIQIAQTLNLNVGSSQSLITDLKRVDYKILQVVAFLMDSAILLEKGFESGLVFAPVIEPEHDGAFFTTKSHESLSKGEFYQVPTIIGYNSLEGAVLADTPVSLYYERYDFNVSDLVPIDMNINDRRTLHQAGSEIRNHYYGILPIFVNSTNTARYFSEDHFVRPVHETLKLQSGYAYTYCYRFSYEGSLSGVDHTRSHGTRHAEDGAYMFRLNGASSAASSSDQLTRARLIKLWTNFAKYGHPTPVKDSLLGDVNWVTYPVYKNPQGACLEVGNNLTIVTNSDREAVEFYRQLYDKYGRPPYDTY